jgi:nicotinamide mononucleotide transporter
MIKNWTTFEKAWLLSFTAVGIALSTLWGSDLIGFLAFMTGIICVVLVAKGSLWNYAFGIVNVALYAWIAYGNKLYGEVMLNALYYLPMQFIGYYVWSKAMDNKEVVTRQLTKPHTVALVAITLVSVFLYKEVLTYLGGSLALLDATTTVVSVIAAILMTLRYREQWLLWIVVNIVSIAMWTLSGNPIMVAMWSAYLVNAVYGYYKWSK